MDCKRYINSGNDGLQKQICKVRNALQLDSWKRECTINLYNLDDLG